MMPHIVGYMVLLFLVYGGFYYAFAQSDSIFGLAPGPAVCHNNDEEDKVCRRPDLFAFQMASVVSMYTSAILGMHAWYVTRRPHRALPATPQGRLFGFLPEAERLSAYALAYQAFDWIVSWTIPEHCTFIMMTHHALAAAVAYVSIRYTVLHYYSFFFLGLSEVSTLFLIWMDLANYFPPPSGTWMATFIESIAGPAFCLTFIWYRVIAWWPMSIRLFRDAHAVLSTGWIQKARPGQPSWVLWVFLLSNLPLGLLQLYWLSIILQEAQKALAGE